MIVHDRVRVTAVIPGSPERVFRLFTEDVDRWWRRGPRFRFGRRDGTLRFEGGVGGRLVEDFGPEEPPFEVGVVEAWEPGVLLRFGYRARSFAPGESTWVQVSFEAHPGGTRVVLVHGGWDGFAAEHPVRHRLDPSSFDAMIGLMWADQMGSLRRQPL